MMLKPRKSGSKAAGFTLIELIIVIAIISILASIAAMNYQHSVWRAREAVLRNDLFALRSSIDQYTLDKQKAPQSLQDLAAAGYIKTVPKDPITNSDGHLGYRGGGFLDGYRPDSSRDCGRAQRQQCGIPGRHTV